MALAANEAVFMSLEAKWSGDADKLGGGVVSQGVRDFKRMGHPRSALSDPYIVVDITTNAFDTLTADAVRAFIRMHLFIKRQTAIGETGGTQGEADAIMADIRTVYHRATLADQTGWTSGSVFIGRQFDVPHADDTMLHFITELETTVCKT